MAKKITAPHSYDPGKGRPKEYLAYLNEREMAYLRSINGNNMERGPRGLPSFPPEDAVGSSSKAGSKGPGGPSGPNSGPSRSGSPSTGGGGKGPGGPSGPNSGPSGGLGGGSKGAPGSSPSSPGGLRGAGGNYGPGSGRPGTTSSAGGGYKGPSSPMGGQGPSFSNDTKAQQEAQVRDAIKAVKNTPAFRNDATSGGIRTLSVGPIGTPVNVGPRVTPTAPQKQFYERIAPGTTPSTSISSQFPSYKYSSPLTPGMTPEDMTRRGAMMNQIEQEMRDMGLINRPAVVRTGSPIDAGGIPTGGRSPGKTRGLSITSPAEAATPGPEEKILEVENVPESAGMSFTPSLPTYSVKDPVSAKNREKYINAVTTSAAGNPFQKVSGVGDVYDPNAQFSEQPKIPSNVQGSYPGGVKSIDVGEPKDEGFSGIESSGEIVREGEFNYPTNPDGTPMTAEDLDNLPPEIKSEYFNKARVARQWDKPYPLTKAEKEKGYVAGAIGSLFKRGPIGAALKVASLVPGEFGDAAEKLSNVRKTVNAYDRLDPLKKQQMREREGKGRGFGGGSTSTTSPGGGITDIGSGGKNEPPRISPVEKEAPKPPIKPKEGGPRPSIYYKWDLGVDVPSPTDSDYTLYLKYLQEKAAAKAGFA